MQITISDEIKKRILIGVRKAFLKTKESCKSLTHTKRDLYPRFFRAIFQEELHSLFPNSICESGTTNYIRIFLFENLDVLVINVNDIHRNIQKNDAYEISPYLPFIEFKESNSSKELHKAKLIFELTKEGVPCYLVLQSCDYSFDPIEIIRDESGFYNLMGFGTVNDRTETEKEKPITDFILKEQDSKGEKNG